MESFKTLINEQQLQKRITSLAKQIELDYQGKELVLMPVLKGASFFAIDLAKQIKNKLKITFIELSSYGINRQSSKEVKIKKELLDDITGKDIIVIEDIIDTGITMNFLIEYLKQKNPNSIKVCTLLNKTERREVEVTIDYVGFDIPNKFIVGYGLDYEEYYRNLPYIAYAED